MTVLPRAAVKRGSLLGVLQRFKRPAAGAYPAPAVEDGDIELWRGYLQSSEGALRQLDLRSIGAAEDEADAELCLVKGEVLQRAGYDFDAQRFLRRAPRLSPTRRSASVMALRAA